MTMKRQASTVHRAEGWTAYERTYGRGGEVTVVVKAHGEIAPMGYGGSRPATEAEIQAEQARRVELQQLTGSIAAFRARPDWQHADDIRAAIELMEWDNHPLDRLTPEEWRALRNKICG